MRLKSVCINEKEQIFLDGIEVNNVTDYKLENSAGSNEPAKLTVTMLALYCRGDYTNSDLF